MSYQALARTWRPRNFDQLVGQQHVVTALSNAMRQGRVHHAMLFSGTRGVGKTTLGRIIAKCLNCLESEAITATPCGRCEACTNIDEGRYVDLIEIDAASRTKVDDTRELLDNVQYAPTRGRYKVYLIDEVHMLSKHSFNALLKTLEEPPPHVRFLLATTDPQKLPITILSRCLQFNLKRLPVAQIQARLEEILSAESIGYEVAGLQAIARAADGSMRDGLSLTDQAIAFCGDALTADAIREMLGSVAACDVLELIRVCHAADAPSMGKTLEALDAQAPDFDQLLAEMAAALQRMAVRQLVPDYPEAGPFDGEALEQLAVNIPPEDVQLYYQMCMQGRRELPWAPDPRAGFEMTLLRMMAFRPASSVPQKAPAKPQAQAIEPAASEPEPVRSRPDSSETAIKATPAMAPVVPLPTPVGPNDAAPSVPPQLLVPVDWPKIVAQLPAGGLGGQLARHSECLACNDTFVLLRLDADVAHLAGGTEQGGQGGADSLQSALRELLDQPKLRLEIETGSLETTSAAAQEHAEAQRRQVEAEQAVASDDNVQAFVSRFGASVREGSIRPLDTPKSIH